ncbi:SdiA-regulated domain-containing protein [Roseivirga sp. BDSF3-8]|uniref:SdiA-regulated domain-containing protein n=1 Tax=Roseivirga sp. BDSF3-8 TaxID=3241598 RepID=UPI0035321837
MYLIVIILTTLFTPSCHERVNHKGEFDYEEVKDSFFYDLNEPDDRFELPADLEEISGLTWLDDGMLGAIQDEVGHMFYISATTGEVVNEIKFGTEGDYEGVENVEDILFAIKSNGKLYRFPVSDEDVEGELFDNPLNIKNNVEGLGYWPERNMLLIGCKEDQKIDEDDLEDYEDEQGIEEDDDDEKEYKDDYLIYGFDVSENRFITNPILAIDEDDIEDFFEDRYKGEFEGDKFAISGVAFHSLEKRLYLISSAARMLMIVDMEGNVTGMHPLDRDVLRQPEGLCVAPDGTLYIASEGRGGDGYFVRYRYRK